MRSKKVSLITILAFLCMFSFAMFSSVFYTAQADTQPEITTLVSGTFEMIDGVSLKFNDDGGIRFKVKMSEDVNEFVSTSNVELGFIIAPKQLLDGETNYLTMEQKIQVVAEKSKIYEDGGYYIANGCIARVLEENRQLEFTAIAYILQEGNVQYTALNDNSRGNLYDVVNQAVLDVYTEDVFNLTSYNTWYATQDYPIVIKDTENYDALINKINASDVFSGKTVKVNEGVKPSEGKEITNPNAPTVKKEYSITFDRVIGDDVVIKVLEGEKPTAPANSVKAGYTYSWGEMEVVNGAKTYTEIETVNTNTAYTVKHFKQNLENDEYTEVIADKQELTGTTDTNTNAVAKEYTGFTAKQFSQVNIAGDGSAVVSIYYDRNLYTVTWFDGETAIETDTNVKYGATPSYDGDALTKDNYTFIGWYTALEGGQKLANDSTITQTQSLYAHWAPSTTSRIGDGFDITETDSTVSYVAKSASLATFDGVSLAEGSVSADLIYDKTYATRTGLIFKGTFNNTDPLDDTIGDYGKWATGVGASYYMFYIEMQSGTLLLYKTEGNPGYYIETTRIENVGEAYRTKFKSGATEFNLKATYCKNENGGLIIKLYIDDELQLWFEDADPLQGTAVGLCSNIVGTEFKNVGYDATVTEEMGSPIVTTKVGFTVSKGQNGEYNTYKGWPNSRSIAFLKDVNTGKNVGSSGTLTANITPNKTKNAIVLFSKYWGSGNVTNLSGMHFYINPTATGYQMYISIVGDVGNNEEINNLGAYAPAIDLPDAESFDVEINYEVQASGDIVFTFKATVKDDPNVYTRMATWPTAWDNIGGWLKRNYDTKIAIWQETGGSSVVFGDVAYTGDNKAIYALNATLDSSNDASGTAEMDVALNGTDLAISLFGEVTGTYFGYMGVVCYIQANGTVQLIFVKDANNPGVAVAQTSVNVSKAMHVSYGYSIDANGICTYIVHITQEGEAPVDIVYEATPAPIGNYWNQTVLGNKVVISYQRTPLAKPVVENFVYTQN